MQRLIYMPPVCTCSWRRAWQPTPVFLPGESHGRRSLEDYSPWDSKESDKHTQYVLVLKPSMSVPKREVSIGKIWEGGL